MCTSVLEQQFDVLAVWLGVPTSVLCNRTLRIDNFIGGCLSASFGGSLTLFLDRWNSNIFSHYNIILGDAPYVQRTEF